MDATLSSTLQLAPETEIQNVFTVARFGHWLDLDEIGASLPYARTQFTRNNGLLYRLDDPEATLVMYAKGLIVTIAARSVEHSIKAIRKTIKRIRKLDIIVREDPTISIRNIVANASIPYKINIEQAAMVLENTTYEPEQFSGLVYRPDQDAAVILFSEGKMTITGVNEESQIDEIAQDLTRRLIEYGLIIK